MKKFFAILSVVIAAAAFTACTEKDDETGAAYPTAESLSVNQTTLFFEGAGETASLSATVTPSDAAVTWASTDPAVATVYNGVVTARGRGNCDVYAMAGDLKAVCAVTVGADIKAERVELDVTELTLKAGETATLTAVVLPEDNTDELTVVWSSSDEAVATVAEGVVTAVAPGTATVTATAGTLTADCAVTVTGDTVPGDEGDPNHVISLGGNYFSVTWPESLKTLDEVTMEGWVYGDSFTSGGNDGLHTMMGVEGIFLIRFDGNKPEVVYGGTQKSNGEYNEAKVTCSTTLADKEWHHIAATYKKSGSVVLYVDGEQVGTGTAQAHGVDMNGVGAGWAGGGLADWHFYIGVSCQTSRDFDGSMADLRVWKTARSASDIKADMKNASPSKTDLIGYWRMNEGSGDTVKDSSGAGRDLQANSTLSWIEGTRPF